MAKPSYPFCVYTLLHSTKLVALWRNGGTGTFHTGQRWVTPKSFLTEALNSKQALKVLFAWAEDTTRVIAVADLTKITVDTKGTDFRADNLRFFSPPFLKTLLRKRDSSQLPASFIKPYAICKFTQNLIQRATASIPQSIPFLGEESVPDRVYREGAIRAVRVNAFERNPAARAECLRHHGYSCKACGMTMGERYGDEAALLIHVHHARPLKELRKSYVINPRRDLVPVCPNCHAVIHSGEKQPRTVGQVRAMLLKQRKRHGATGSA